MDDETMKTYSVYVRVGEEVQASSKQEAYDKLYREHHCGLGFEVEWLDHEDEKFED